MGTAQQLQRTTTMTITTPNRGTPTTIQDIENGNAKILAKPELAFVESDGIRASPDNEVDHEAVSTEQPSSSCWTLFRRRRRSYKSRYSITAAYSILTVSGVFAILSINSIGSVASIQGFLSIASINSCLSIASVNSMLAIGCKGSFLKICI